MTEKKFSYNAAMQEVEQILVSLESNNLEVDEMSRKVKRATELLQACKNKLYQADAEIQAIFEQTKM
jgi:exodeoxyribonuclease VII small subunit